MFLECLKDTSFLSTSTESDDEQHLHDVQKHEKCSGILSSVKAATSRNKKQFISNPIFFYERMSQVATTPSQLSHLAEYSSPRVKKSKDRCCQGREETGKQEEADTGKGEKSKCNHHQGRCPQTETPGVS